MKKLLIVLTMSMLPLVAMAAEEMSCGTIECKKVTVDPTDKPSLQRGAQTFVNYCMGCHEASYSRYGRVAEDLGIPDQLVMDNLIFDDSKIGDLMTNGMTPKDAKKWFGVAPPDLTLVTRARGEDWVYTYLLSFYQDSSRPWGVNNLVFKDVGMPHALRELQGLTVCKPAWAIAANGGVKRDPLTGNPQEDPEHQCGRVEHVEGTGLSDKEYEAVVYDLTNFLAYVGEPTKMKSHKIGMYVLLFLCVLFIFVYLLNREYWKDIH
ncbi:ubiquinol-cytochrome c reductase cytochrome c1 subunit [Sinobacterium caligoides]|uniref:Ubiquinol-cytochrome c reductase cytochrome c1 subunit n=1 Tax=Sinobacterium caligoides TaxID=933926 RepID=A0A3N2E1X0_9GAMM|nr:ubiquinol-cytochrome c reductase cytochrome c1 subunit [Sinobacterium caligoides]